MCDNTEGTPFDPDWLNELIGGDPAAWQTLIQQRNDELNPTILAKIVVT